MPEFMQLEDWGSVHNVCIEIGRYTVSLSGFMSLLKTTE